MSTTYLSPTGRKTESEIRKLVKSNISIVLGGDFNHNFDKSDDIMNPDRESLLEFGRRTDFSQILSSYTRTTTKSSKIIDLIFIKTCVTEFFSITYD